MCIYKEVHVPDWVLKRAGASRTTFAKLIIMKVNSHNQKKEVIMGKRNTPSDIFDPADQEVGPELVYAGPTDESHVCTRYIW